jgi:Flp pilus assembly protein TadD
MDYCQKLLWPSHLCIFYPIHQQIDWSRTVINIVCLVAITAAAFAMRKIFPAGIVGWLYFLVTLVPVIGLVQVGGQAMADRYSYIPSIGFFIVLIWGLCLVADRNRVFGKIAFAIVIAIVVGLAAATTQQIGHWKSSVSLFQHALDVTHENAQATIFLGDSMIQEGNVDAGLKLLNDAAKERPNSGEIHGRIAKTLAGIGRIEESEAEYHAALVLEPNLVEALNNLAWMLATSTDAKNRNGAEAVTLALHSCELTRYRMPIHIGTLAAAYAEAGRFAEAIKSGEQARDLARSQGDEAVAQTNEQLLSLYREGKAYHPAQ